MLYLSLKSPQCFFMFFPRAYFETFTRHVLFLQHVTFLTRYIPFSQLQLPGCSEHGCMCMRYERGGENSQVGHMIKEDQEAFLLMFSVGTGHLNFKGWVKTTVI